MSWALCPLAPSALAADLAAGIGFKVVGMETEKEASRDRDNGGKEQQGEGEGDEFSDVLDEMRPEMVAKDATGVRELKRSIRKEENSGKNAEKVSRSELLPCLGKHACGAGAAA